MLKSTEVQSIGCVAEQSLNFFREPVPFMTNIQALNLSSALSRSQHPLKCMACLRK